ncbi:probable pectinesterase/pectinesterase inhibitor 46 [Salvia hispanica]|uniref:probable pectinesterase/pectinesterase inhibitor 46 n=1 Tax=Salvia hispanica TaxID=49212 RepID=UPI002009693A|nr:probable pectinesterase/pectinesterase inhibitor 46 [Salvia hispanica]
MASFNPYGNLNEAEQEGVAARRKTRQRITIIVVSSIVLVAIMGGIFLFTQTRDAGGLSTSLKASCAATLYPNTCYTSLSPLIKPRHVSPHDIYKLSLQVSLGELSRAADGFFQHPTVQKVVADNNRTLAALESCRELFSLALDHLNDSASSAAASLHDHRTWLSAAATYQETCVEDLSTASAALGALAAGHLGNCTEYTSNSLALVSAAEEALGGGAGGRRMLEMPAGQMKFDAVVARDGSGGYTTIAAALKMVPEKSKKRFVIYVKRGTYFENVRIEKKMWNVMMIGDGKDATIVSGRLNHADGTPTFQSATFAVKGKGFMVRDMGFVNTAGASKGQAVALMSTADRSAFYRCKMDGYQDTLYPHSNRQFYRECDIYGTVDFIFGNAAVVIQNCNIMPKLPLHGQKNTITAQGKKDPNQNTGISIHNCIIRPTANLTGVNNFLGRPWKNYSTTIFLQNKMEGFIDPKGWLPWVGTTAPSTIFYAEYRNWGPGAGTSDRVKWSGLRLKLNAQQVSRFTVEEFINRDKWINEMGVTYKSGL